MLKLIFPFHKVCTSFSLNVLSKCVRYCNTNSQGIIDLKDPAIQKYLKRLVVEYNDLKTRVQLDREERARLFEITPIVNVIDEKLILEDHLSSLKDLRSDDPSDKDMEKLIKEEKLIYEKQYQELEKELVNVLFKSSISEGGVLLEVIAGAGGQEAMLFAKELLEMYHAYAEYKGWEVDIASLEKSDTGGIRKGSLLIEGLGAIEIMKVEAGVHRVQRIPATEKSGRMHTSTVSVAILPQPTEFELDIPDRDVQVETKRASGAGGQHVNKTESAVRITHLPSGIVVECQEGRSQIKNKQIAFQKLRTLLLQKQYEEQSSKIRNERKSQIGSGERNEKIRTYNFPQDRITEHRPGGGTLHGIKAFMSGGPQLESLQAGILKHLRFQKLMDEINEVLNQKERLS